MPVQVPEEARCLKCGYRLRELDEPVCPECARRFDPADPMTYNADPRRRRRRRIVRWLVILLVIVSGGYALWPRQILNARITFAYVQSGRAITVRRWEPQAPSWIPLRYPGFNWRTIREGTGAVRPDEPYTFTINAKFVVGTLAGSGGSSENLTVNGIPADPDHAGEILASLLAPENAGIAFGTLADDPSARPADE